MNDKRMSFEMADVVTHRARKRATYMVIGKKSDDQVRIIKVKYNIKSQDYEVEGTRAIFLVNTEDLSLFDRSKQFKGWTEERILSVKFEENYMKRAKRTISKHWGIK